MSNQAELLREAVELLKTVAEIGLRDKYGDRYASDEEEITAFLAKIDAATLVPEGAAIAAEYIEAKRAINAGPPQPDGSHRPPRSWKHGDPEVIRWHKAAAALSTLAASGRQDGAR